MAHPAPPPSPAAPEPGAPATAADMAADPDHDATAAGTAADHDAAGHDDIAADHHVADGSAADDSGTRAPSTVVVVSRVAVAAIAAYAGAQVIADIASVKIGTTFGRAVDMGTFIYPITFTLRDLVHKALGRRAARTLVVSCAGVNLFMALYLQWAARVEPDPSYGLDSEFRAILGPLWRIVVASIIAEVVSELADTEVYHWFVRRVTTRYQWARVLVSNAVSVPLDNVLFAVLAFGAIPGFVDDDLTLPWTAVWDIFLVNLTVKAAVSALSLPLIYLSPDRDWSADPDDA